MISLFSAFSELYNIGFKTCWTRKKTAVQERKKPSFTFSPVFSEKRINSGAYENDLIEAFWYQQDEKIKELLESKKFDVNKHHLLPRLVMFRVPRCWHMYFDFEKGEGADRFINGVPFDELSSKVKQYAELLIRHGATIKVSDVTEFLLYQKKLEKLTRFMKDSWASKATCMEDRQAMQSCQRFGHSTIDMGGVCAYLKIGELFKHTKNPYILIMHQSNQSIYPEHQRKVCAFVAKLLPQLLKLNVEIETQTNRARARQSFKGENKRS